MKRDPEKARAWRQRSARLSAKGARARRDADAIEQFRLDLKWRSRGFCEAQTPACPPHRHDGCHAHHTRIHDRDAGRHDAERGLWVCAPGHHYIHMHPAESYAQGWLVRYSVEDVA